MGSKVEPYFILTAEKVRDPKELQGLEKKSFDIVAKENLPTTPPPSGVSGNNGFELGPSPNSAKKKKGTVKYKIPVKELKRKDSLTKRMEVIKERLEKSRERVNEQKSKQRDTDLKCEPTKHQPEEMLNPFKMERSVSDITYLKSGPGTKHEVQSPAYVYFVVTDERLATEAEKMISKSAGKRRRIRLVEENRLKRERKERQSQKAKKLGLAREIGLKSSLELKSDASQNEIQKPVVNHIIFQGPDTSPPKPQHQSSAKVIRSAHSPPRIPPGTPATSLTLHSTTLSGENKVDITAMDADDNVPRKPFLSGPLYLGKTRVAHSSIASQHFELPNISADQKRRALGLGTMFEEFAYPKPQAEQKQRRVSFADNLPVIRGSGFVLDHNGDHNEGGPGVIPALGPRAHTLGSITLPSEKQPLCQKYLAGENASLSSAKTVRKFGVPLPLPKIDIVSNVYDEMIIKMIQEYLQDSNTPSRQSQLAKDLLAYLQKHNEHMKELNVPNINKKTKTRNLREEAAKHQLRAQQLIRDINFTAPPNTAEDIRPKVVTPLTIGDQDTVHDPKMTTEGATKRDVTSAENPRSVPFVQITFKQKELDPDPSNTDDIDRPKDSRNTTRDRKSHERPILSVVTPVSFQMAPPGLNRDDSFISVPMKT